MVEEEQECAKEKSVAAEFDEVGAIRAFEEAFVGYSIVKGSVLLYNVVLSVCIQRGIFINIQVDFMLCTSVHVGHLICVKGIQVDGRDRRDRGAILLFLSLPTSLPK